jgi:hypothetical protein
LAKRSEWHVDVPKVASSSPSSGTNFPSGLLLTEFPLQKVAVLERPIVVDCCVTQVTHSSHSALSGPIGLGRRYKSVI